MRQINWSDEPYVRLYRHDHPDWISLSWQAKGVYTQLRRKADRAGLLPLGMAGLASLAGHMGHSSEAAALMPFFEELLAFKWVELLGDYALITDFIESESAQASPAQRTRQSREKRRDMAKLSGRPAASSVQYSVIPNTVTSTRVLVTSNHEDVTSTRDRVTTSVTSSVTNSVTTGVGAGHTARNQNGENDECSLPITFTSPSPLPDQIPPSPPPTSKNPGREEQLNNEDGDPNLQDIRLKLAKQPKPICFLVLTRAEERFYAPVLTGSMTVEHVLAAIDDAALTLGPELGTVEASDPQGLANVERYVAGCVKRARRDRRTDQSPLAPIADTRPHARQLAPVPEAPGALAVYRDLYVSVGRYERFIEGADDARHVSEAFDECRKHVVANGSPMDAFIDAATNYLLDAFFSNQAHSLHRFSVLMHKEPARFLGKRSTTRQFTIDDYHEFQQVIDQYEKKLHASKCSTRNQPPDDDDLKDRDAAVRNLELYRLQKKRAS